MILVLDSLFATSRSLNKCKGGVCCGDSRALKYRHSLDVAPVRCQAVNDDYQRSGDVVGCEGI